jgi:hypothetical protein
MWMKRGHIVFLTAVIAAIIILAAPDLPKLPGPVAMECQDSHNADNQYCKTMSVVIITFRHFVDKLDRYKNLFVVIGTLIIAWFIFAVLQSTHRLWLVSQDQGTNTRNAISEIVRAANAMESVADNLRTSVELSRKTTNIFSATARTQIRAYLSLFDGPFINQNPDRGSRLEFRSRIKNTGFSPARDVVFTSVARVLPSPLADDVDLTLPVEQVGVAGTINAGQEFTIRSIMDRVMDRDEFIRVTRQLTPLIHVYGRIEYRDVFNQLHYTHFCKMILWDSPNSVAYVNTRRHNDSN